MSGLRVAVVGATGAVGRNLLELLEARSFPASEIVPFASARSAGKEIEGVGVVQPLREDTIAGFDLALFSAGGGASGEWAPRFSEAGAVVVDNSSRWRTDPTVPLVVSEVNPEALDSHRGIVANPNCSTMQLMVVLKPLRDAAGLERLIVSTYQSVSGTGVRALEELRAQTRAALADEELPAPHVYPHPIAFNVLGGAGNFPDGSDSTDEELKMIFETRKILSEPELGIAVTCARVPVTFSHSESVLVETSRPIEPDEVRELLRSAPGVEVVDDPAAHGYPTARAAAGRDEVLVGRIRRDPSHAQGIQLWVVADNLRKGAATNAVQLAELIVERGLLRRDRPFAVRAAA